MERAGGDDAVMIGDSVWDCDAAKRARVPTIGVLSGGFNREELEEVGARPYSSRSPSSGTIWSRLR